MDDLAKIYGVCLNMRHLLQVILRFLVEILFTIIKMVYSISQKHSHENERKLRGNIPDYEKFRREVQRDNRESFKKRQKEIYSKHQILMTCKNCGAAVKYFSLPKHRKSQNVKM